MILHYITTIVGDGQTLETAYRPDLPAGVPWSALIPTDEAGRPLVSVAMVDVHSDKETDHEEIEKTAVALPVVEKGEVISRGMDASAKADLAAKIKALGVSDAVAAAIIEWPVAGFEAAVKESRGR